MRSRLIQMLPLQSLYATQWLLSVDRSGTDLWYPAGAASVAATSFSRWVFQPSGSGPAKGFTSHTYAATAAATTPPPTPNQALRPGRRDLRGTSVGGTARVGSGAGGLAASSSNARTRAAFGRCAGSLWSRPLIASASGPRAVAGGAGEALRTDCRVAGVLLRRNGRRPRWRRTSPRPGTTGRSPGRDAGPTPARAR